MELSIIDIDALESVLTDSNAAAETRRELEAFGQTIKSGRYPVVFFGAGYMGRQAARALRAVGMEPKAFIDDRPELVAKEIGGVPVLSIEAVAQQYPLSLIVVSILQPEANYLAILSRLSGYGLSRVAHGASFFCALRTAYDRRTETYFYIDLPEAVRIAHEEILTVFPLLADQRSREEFVTQIRARLLLPYDGPPHEPLAEQYFTKDLFQFLPGESFVDCGAFDGDTVCSFLHFSHHHFGKIWALEPDPKNFKALSNGLSKLDDRTSGRITALPFAVGDTDGTASFEPCGTAEAAFGEKNTSTVEVRCARLDAILRNENPTFIKMDIEGAELEALKGAADTIKRALPVLAVCVYHRQDHLWKIPLFLHSLSTDYRFFLRSYMAGRLETVCYAVPSRRRVLNYARS